VLCCGEGVIPITIRPPNLLNLATTLPTVRMIVDVSKASAVLSTAFVIRVLRSKVGWNVVIGNSSVIFVCKFALYSLDLSHVI